MTSSSSNLSIHPTHPLLNDVQDMAEKLRAMVELLIPPDPTLPHIITYTKIKELFRLTGLGAPAMDTIAQTQRISRTTADYEQIGLCEFHVGLIFLYWGQCQAAAKQFALARGQWQFVNTTPLQCLARFAEGVAFHFAFAYEEAMVRYGRTENCLPRMRFAPPSDNLDQFVATLQMLLQEMTARLQAEMTPEPEVDYPTATAASSLHDTRTSSRPSATIPDIPPSSSEIPLPPTAVDPIRLTSDERVPPPYIGSHPPADRGNGKSPIPNHHKDSSHLKWYYVQERVDGDFLPQIHSGGWVLVDDRVENHDHQNEELVIIQNDHLEGSVPLTKSDDLNAAPYQRIYLAKFIQETTELTNEPLNFDRDPSTGRIAFSKTKLISAQETKIIGIVVGFWQSAGLVNKP